MSWCKSRRGSTAYRTTGVNLDVSDKDTTKEITPVAQNDLGVALFEGLITLPLV